MNEPTLRLADIVWRCCVLGPGWRTGLWVQGCPMRCPGCMTPEFQPFRGGLQVEIAALARHIAEEFPDVEGVTYMGGEPFAAPHADGLAQLSVALRARRDLSIMAYTGYTIEQLLSAGTRNQRQLLGCLDLLIDGPYERDLHRPLRWRGSSNQRIHVLTDRHHHVLEEPDEPAGLELRVLADGTVDLTGVPPKPDFRAQWLRSVRYKGERASKRSTSAVQPKEGAP